MGKRIVTSIFLICALAGVFYITAILVKADDAEPTEPSLQELINKQNSSLAGKQGANYGEPLAGPLILAARIIKIFLTMLGTLFVVYTVYAGYLYLTAAGEEERITKATGMIKNGVLGIIIILSSWSIAYLVYDIWVEAQKNPFGSYTEFKIKKDTTDFYNKDPYEESTTKPFNYQSNWEITKQTLSLQLNQGGDNFFEDTLRRRGVFWWPRHTNNAVIWANWRRKIEIMKGNIFEFIFRARYLA